MTREKEKQLAWLKEEIVTRVEYKFRKGDREHGESLMNLDLIEETAWELIDGLVYILLQIKKNRDSRRARIKAQHPSK